MVQALPLLTPPAMGGEAEEPQRSRGCVQGPRRRVRAVRPLLLTRAFLHRAPLLEGRAVRPLNRERASRIGEGVDHEAERQRLHEERVEDRTKYLTGPRQQRGPGVLAIPEARANAQLVPLAPHWAQRRTRGQRHR